MAGIIQFTARKESFECGGADVLIVAAQVTHWHQSPHIDGLIVHLTSGEKVSLQCNEQVFKSAWQQAMEESQEDRP